MERACEYDDVRSSCCVSCYLDSVLISLGTGAYEECLLLLTSDRRDLAELFCQCYIRLVSRDVEHGVEVLISLCLDRFDQLRM